jgi:hypothetical protein
MHTPRHPHPPHGHQPPTNAGHSGREHSHSVSSLITDKDRQLLMQLLNNPQEAQEMFSMLQNSPPEIANLGYLILRVFERSAKV